MTQGRINLAHLNGLVLALSGLLSGLGGCADSHGLTGDAGTDAPLGPDSPFIFVDAAAGADTDPADVGAVPLCSAARVAIEECPAFLCDAIPQWYWSGDHCFAIDCGACVGPDCGASGYSSEEECSRDHAGCTPQLCRDTGGEWLFWAEECEHRVCGNPGLAICEVGMPVCDCGPYRMFDETRGCVEAVPSCGVLPGRSREALCTGSGGTWGSVCCDSVCGQPCAAACAADACTCGPTQIFDDERGCIEADQCHQRGAGESCGSPTQRCDAGLICCQRCGGAGCFGEPTCQAPLCDADPDTDRCGNNRLAP